jgi:hypothetical protein
MNSTDETPIEEKKKIQVTWSELRNAIVLCEELQVRSLCVWVLEDGSEVKDREGLHGFDEKQKLILWKRIENLFEKRLDGEESGVARCRGGGRRSSECLVSGVI